MEVKINNNGTLVDATIEMVDGVMVVSPKVEKFEPKDGDVFCVDSLHPCVGIVKEEYSYGKPDKDRLYFSVGYWIQSGNMQFGTFCACNRNTEPSYRPATEEEKQKLFNKLKEEGYEWDADKKELVKLKWKPKYNNIYWSPALYDNEFIPWEYSWQNSEIGNKRLEKGWVFRTEEECKQFCNKLNKAIEGVKP
jgi:hypothetical protein